MGSLGDDGGDLARILAIRSVRCSVTGDAAELADLAVRAVQRVRCVLVEDGNAELRRARPRGRSVVGDDDELRLVAGDRLDVRVVARKRGAGSVRRQRGVVVGGDDLFAGADREEDLGGGRREGDDPSRSGLQRHRTCCRFERHRKAGPGVVADEVADEVAVIAARGEERDVLIARSGAGATPSVVPTAAARVRFPLHCHTLPAIYAAL